MDVLPKFREIIEKIESIKQAIVVQSGINYTSQDARMVALDSLQITISAVGMWIHSNNSLANFCTKGSYFDKKEFLKCVDSGLNIEQTEKIMYDHLRLGFMTLVHFKLDNLFYNILKHINALPCKTGYWNLTDSILDQCSLLETGTDKNCLTAFANLRNSLHGNGIHNTNDLSIQLSGLSFNFIKGQRVECSSWNHILIILDSNIDVLNKILLSNKVANIQAEIIDEFASGK
ncbi:MAG: hypothetical protein HGA87_03570 [Desulfobulbaceae bacterium]|nr:hypothetical protein [Desulfobulbaceae bacterium]